MSSHTFLPRRVTEGYRRVVWLYLFTLLYDVFMSLLRTVMGHAYASQLCCWFTAPNHLSSPGLEWGGGWQGAQQGKPVALTVQSPTLNLLLPLSLTPSQPDSPSACSCNSSHLAAEDDGCLGLFSSWKVLFFLLSP